MAGVTTHPDIATAPSSGEGGERPRRWLVIIVVVWSVLLAGGILWALQRGGPTAREQSTVADALPVVDRAVAEIAAAASVDGNGVVAISGFDRAGDCRVTVMRPGVRYERTVTVVVTPGTEDALLGRVADRLPASYRAKITHTGTSVRRETMSADTGACRDLGDLPTAAGVPGNRAEVTAALDRLAIPGVTWSTNQISCPGGGSLTTVEAISAPGAEPGAFDELLNGLGTPIISTPDLYAYTAESSTVAVRHDPENVVVTATRPCP
jgi:hypothetical protein